MQSDRYESVLDGDLFEMVTAEMEFIYAMYPTQQPETRLIALMEEVGEVARAHLERQNPEELCRELIQVAAVALQFAQSIRELPR